MPTILRLFGKVRDDEVPRVRVVRVALLHRRSRSIVLKRAYKVLDRGGGGRGEEDVFSEVFHQLTRQPAGVGSLRCAVPMTLVSAHAGYGEGSREWEEVDGRRREGKRGEGKDEAGKGGGGVYEGNLDYK